MSQRRGALQERLLPDTSLTSQQWRVISIISFSSTLCSAHMTISAFVERVPTMECIHGAKVAPGGFEICSYHEKLDGVTRDWSLVSDRAYLLTTCTVSFWAFLVIGSIVAGFVADAVGRRKAFMGSSIVAAVGSFLVVASVSVEMYIFARVVVGLGTAGLLVSGWVMAMESSGHACRAWAGAVFIAGMALGMIFLASVEGRMFTSWRSLYGSLAFLQLLPVAGSWCLPETVWWHHSQRNTEEAIAVRTSLGCNDDQRLPQSPTINQNRTEVLDFWLGGMAPMLPLFPAGGAAGFIANAIILDAWEFGSEGMRQDVFASGVGIALGAVMWGFVYRFCRRRIAIGLWLLIGAATPLAVLATAYSLEEIPLPHVSTSLAAVLCECGAMGCIATTLHAGAELSPTAMRGAAVGAVWAAVAMGSALPGLRFVGNQPQAVLISCFAPASIMFSMVLIAMPIMPKRDEFQLSHVTVRHREEGVHFVAVAPTDDGAFGDSGLQVVDDDLDGL